MTRGRTPLLGDYGWDRARRDFEAGVYPAVIAIRLGEAFTESDGWNRADTEGWSKVGHLGIERTHVDRSDALQALQEAQAT